MPAAKKQKSFTIPDTSSSATGVRRTTYTNVQQVKDHLQKLEVHALSDAKEAFAEWARHLYFGYGEYDSLKVAHDDKKPHVIGVHSAFNLEKDLQSEWASFVLTTSEGDAFSLEKFRKDKVKNFAKKQLMELAKFWFDMNTDSDFVFPKHEAPSGSYIEDEWFMGIMVKATRGKLFGIDRPDSDEE